MLSKDAYRLRDAIANASNPEKIFFEEIPRALGYTVNDLEIKTKLEEFAIQLRNATQELSASFENLYNRIELVLNDTIGDKKLSFPENKLLLQKRFSKIRKDSLTAKSKVLIQRINTPLEDRKSWINSIATVVLNKSLDKYTDNDEKAFQTHFPELIHELDNLTDISKGDIDENKEEVLKFEITTFVKGVQKNLVRMPKNKSKEINKLAEQIKPLLNSKDKQANIALLINLLQEQIENE
jgi:soluble cytochrome b562